MTRREKLALLLILGLSVVLSFYYQSQQWLSGDQWQMLNKGFVAALSGEYLPYGNEASTMGNVPGSLSSIVIGLPLAVWFHPYAPVMVLKLTRLAGVLLFIDALRQLFSPRTVVMGTLLYALNPWFLYDSLLYNPAYLSFGAAVVLNMLVRLRREGQHKLPYGLTFLYSLLLTLGVGWCLQLHFSWPVLVALTGILWLLRAIRFSFIGAAAGLILLGISLIPYLQEVLINDAITSNPTAYAKERYFGYGLVHVYPMFKALLYWLRFGSLLVTNKAMVPELAATAPWYQDALYYLWLIITQGIGGITVLFAALVNYKIIRRRVQPETPALHFVRALTISSIGALLLAAAAATLTLNYWQIIILFCFALLPVVCYLEYRPLRVQLGWALGVFMVVSNVISANASEKFSYKADYSTAFYQYCLKTYTPAQCHLSAEQAAAVQSVDLTKPED